MTIGGGFKAIKSVVTYARKIGPFKLAQAVTSKNACKACAFGTGGQRGGLRNESGSLIEICNKNIQSHLSDIRPAIDNTIFFQHSISHLSTYTGKQLEDLGRMGVPLYKGANDKHYRPMSYDKAFDLIAKKFSEAPPERSFFYASGRSSNEAAFLMQLLARASGSNNINNCSYYCHQASGVGLNGVIGVGTATVEFADLEKSDCIFVLGANPASNHPRFVKTLLQCRRRGGQVIVINPAKEAGLVKFASPSDFLSMIKGGESVASHYLQPHIGGDVALLLGIAKHVIESDAIDKGFIANHTDNFTAYKALVESCGWDNIESRSGVDKEQIIAVANAYIKSKSAVFSWGMGMTHHLHGVNNIEMIAALALLRGMIGKAGAGLLPLRGHSNIQGMGTMGVTPQLKPEVLKRLAETLTFDLPTHDGLDTMACIHKSHAGEMDFALMCGGNLYASNPNSNYAAKALSNIPFKVFISPTLNIGHVNGVGQEQIILPILVRDEEKQSTTQESMFSYVRLSDGGIERFSQLKSEVDIFTEIGKRCINSNKVDFSVLTSHNAIRKWIAKVIPGFEAIENIGSNKEEFQISGRTFHSPIFKTETGRANFPTLNGGTVNGVDGLYLGLPLKVKKANIKNKSQFTLMTVRSEGQFNSIIFDERDTYREQSTRNVVMMNIVDIQLLGLSDNACVSLKTDVGEMKGMILKAFDVRQGNIMTYYPEANVLIPHAVDERSQTPAFKSVLVEVLAEV